MAKEDQAYLSVKNFDRFQHYKNRRPVWIKLYNDLLDDYEFARLPDAAKLHLVMIWLLASRHENRVPADPVWIARQIGATEPVDLTRLASAGFITICDPASKLLASCYQVASIETEKETEVETEREKETSSPPPDARDTRARGQQQEEERVEITDMRIDLSETLDRIPDPTTRRRIAASARMLMSGDDLAAWRDPRGDGGQIPWAERPRLWRLALAKLEADGHYGANDLHGNVKYIALRELSPLPARKRDRQDTEAGRVETEEPGAGRSHRAELRPLTHDPAAEREAERREQEAIATWLRDHPEERDALRAEIEAAMKARPEWAEMDARFLVPAVDAEVRKRVRLKLERAA